MRGIILGPHPYTAHSNVYGCVFGCGSRIIEFDMHVN